MQLTATITVNLQLVLIVTDIFIASPVVQSVENAIHWINHSVVCFVHTYPLDSDLSGGWRY